MSVFRKIDRLIMPVAAVLLALAAANLTLDIVQGRGSDWVMAVGSAVFALIAGYMSIRQLRKPDRPLDPR